MQQNTHLKIDQTLNGRVLELKEDYAKVILKTTSIMIADREGLVHGGFIFGAADFTAMVAVNHPFVVLAKSEVKFLAPVKEGEIVTFEGNVTNKENHRASVEVVGIVADKPVFKGVFYTAILEKHVLS
jgi:acyl-coenzyme A thioesterase PaaI-like protein